MKAKGGNSLQYLNKKGYVEAVSDEEIFGWIFNDFLKGVIDHPYTRGLLRDLGFSPAEVFHALEKLGLAREVYESPSFTGDVEDV